MNFENIQMAIARRKIDANKINISQISEENRHDKYECIVCGSEVIPVAPNGKIIGGNNAKVTPHFKHLNSEKCGQETFIHFWLKTEFIKIGDKFKVITDDENEYICNQIFFEKTIIINGKRYTPDATVLTSCGNTIHFEYNYSNKKKIKDYIDVWKELNQIIIEANINSILCVFSDSVPTFKALYYNGKCFNLNEENGLYYNTIGKYKLTKYDEDVLKYRENEIENLDYLWEEIRRIKNEDKDYSGIGELIRSISSDEGKKIAIEILSKVKCGNSILNNYVGFIKDKIDKRLKLLNLKYNGYLIKYKTEIPRLIYDRVFNGIIIKFYLPDDDIDNTEDDPTDTYQTYNYDFKEEILSNIFKREIDKVVKNLSITHNLLLKIINVLQINNKIVDYKLNLKKNVDYIDSIYFKDYRNKTFVLSDNYYNKMNFNNYNSDVFNNFINNDTLFISVNNLKHYNIAFYIVETENSYEFKDYYYTLDFISYKFGNYIKQNINISYYRIDNDFKFLSRYNFIKIAMELNNLKNMISENKDNIIKNFLNTEYFLKVYKEGEKVEVIDEEINKKIRQLLYPIIYYSNKYNSDTLNIRLNKDFTKDKRGKTQGWLIEDFIDILQYFENIDINNIQ